MNITLKSEELVIYCALYAYWIQNDPWFHTTCSRTNDPQAVDAFLTYLVKG